MGEKICTAPSRTPYGGVLCDIPAQSTWIGHPAGCILQRSTPQTRQDDTKYMLRIYKLITESLRTHNTMRPNIARKRAQHRLISQIHAYKSPMDARSTAKEKAQSHPSPCLEPPMTPKGACARWVELDSVIFLESRGELGRERRAWEGL